MQIGDVFSRLKVVALVREGRDYFAECICSCGNHKRVRSKHLRSGATRSCGCLHAELSSARTGKLHSINTTHGKSKSRVYGIWCGMIQRCTNPNSRFFSHYGGRGIAVDSTWLTFETFYDDMGEPPPRHTLERRDNDGPYSKSNCIWATRTAQQNNRRTNRKVTICGETRTIAAWSQLTGIHHNTLTQRIDSGWPEDQLLSREKHSNLQGLSLGGKANGARLRALTHCKNGHEFNEQNTRWTGTQRVCKPCRRDAARLARASTRRRT